MSNPKLKGIVPHFMTVDKDRCSEAVLEQGDGQDNADSIFYSNKKYKKLHSEKVLEIGDCQDSVIAIWGAPFQGDIVKAHSKKVVKIGNGKTNAEALKAVNNWHWFNSLGFGYSKMMSAHSKRVLEVGDALDNTLALMEVKYFKNLWRPHWDKLLEMGYPPHFVLILSYMQIGSNTHEPYGGNRAEFMKVSAEQILSRGSSADNLSALEGVLDSDLRDAFSRKIIEIGNAEENEEAIRFCDSCHIGEQHKLRAQELRKNPTPPTPQDYRFSPLEPRVGGGLYDIKKPSRVPNKPASAPKR